MHVLIQSHESTLSKTTWEDTEEVKKESSYQPAYVKIKDNMGLNTNAQTNDQQVKAQIYKWKNMKNMDIIFTIKII